jgi:hypothetical protein
MIDWGVAGLSLAAVIAAGWGMVKTVLSKVVSLAVVRVKVHYPVSRKIATYLYRHFRRSPWGLLTYDGATEFVRPVRRYQMVGFERAGREPMIFWRRWRPILLSLMPGNMTGGVSEGETVTLSALRGTFDLEALIIAALDESNAAGEAANEDGDRFRVLRYSGEGQNREGTHSGDPRYGPPTTAGGDRDTFATRDARVLKWCREDIGPEKTVARRALDSLSFPTEVLGMVEELRRWLTSETWYRSRGIPWRRGWLLYGKPGTGKTSLVRALAEDLNMPVCVFDLATMSNRELTALWKEAMNYSPCIALIEDIDAVFHGRENVAGERGGGLTFDCLLNCLSGIESATGVFLVITTNRVDVLDEALGIPREGSNGTMISTRPGRLDRALELRTMDESCRRQLAQRILRDCPHEIERLVADGKEDTGSQFQERCAQVALAAHWSAPEGGAVPNRVIPESSMAASGMTERL